MIARLHSGLRKDPLGFWRAGPGGGADEYADADPYEVEQNLTGAFQRMRWAGTEAAVASLPADGPVIDVGCGQGHLTMRLAQRFPAAEVWGIDLSGHAIAAAATRFPADRLVVGSALDLPFQDGQFAGAVLNNLWEHVTDPVALAREVARVLRPGGWLVLSTPNRLRLGAVSRGLRGRAAPLMSALHITEYTAGQVDDQLRVAGLAPDRTFGMPMEGRTPVQRLAGTLLSPLAARIPEWRTTEPTLFAIARRGP